MKTKIIEVDAQWALGKFMVGVWDVDDVLYRSPMYPDDAQALLSERGWTHQHFWLLDLTTGQGACFFHNPDGLVEHDLTVKALDQSAAWKGMRTTQLFGHLLVWLYRQPLPKILALDLPAVVKFEDLGSGEAIGRPVGPGKSRGHG